MHAGHATHAQQYQTKNTLLHTAAAADAAHNVRFLLHHGADRLAANSVGRVAQCRPACPHMSQDGATPLHLAARANAFKSAHELLSFYAPTLDKKVAQFSVKYVVNAADLFQLTPLHYAAQHNAPDVVAMLLAHRANRHALDKVGK